MLRFRTTLRRLLTTELGYPKSMDEASRKKRLKRIFDCVPITYFVCAVVTSVLTYFGILGTGALIVSVLVGLLLVRMHLRPLWETPFIPFGWQFFIYIWFACWLTQDLVRLPHLPAWWGFICELVLRVACAASGVLSAASLVTWAFRDPFWQYVTGEKWPKKPSRPKPVDDVPLTEISIASTPTSALPYNY